MKKSDVNNFVFVPSFLGIILDQFLQFDFCHIVFVTLFCFVIFFTLFVLPHFVI